MQEFRVGDDESAGGVFWAIADASFEQPPEIGALILLGGSEQRAGNDQRTDNGRKPRFINAQDVCQVIPSRKSGYPQYIPRQLLVNLPVRAHCGSMRVI